MVKTVAILALVVTSSLLTLGNYWFTYGIWPRSWIAFTVFFLLSMVNYVLLTVVTQSKRKP